MNKQHVNIRLHNASQLRASRRDDKDFAGTLAKGLLILEAFTADPRPLANSELASRLSLPRSTVSRLCRTLRQLGYLDHDERLDRYFIGPTAIALGYAYVVKTPLLVHARDGMQRLADEVGGAVSIAVPFNLDVVYIETCVNQNGAIGRPAAGAMRGIVVSAIGRAWLHSLSASERATVLQRYKTERPEEFARARPGMESSLRAHGQRGYAINLGDAGFGVLGVGVASRARHGGRLLLFNCAIPGTHAREADLIRRIGPRLLEVVRFAERSAGI